MSKSLFTIFTLLFLIVCKDKPQKYLANNSKKEETDTIIDHNKVKSTDYIFFSDYVFHGQKEILKYYFKKYTNDTCDAVDYDKSELLKEFEGLYQLGNIRKKIKASVFVLNPLSYCKFDNEDDWNGETYYFTDTALPRLQTNSYCCHPSNIFLTGDIDEDGISEIGEYYSSCSSHYKSLLVWTLKDNRWEKIGSSVFDQHYMNYEKPFSSYVRKIAKGKFEMYEQTDLTDDKTKIGKPNWIQFSM